MSDYSSLPSPHTSPLLIFFVFSCATHLPWVCASVFSCHCNLKLHSQEAATFDLTFRKNPFDGEYTIFAGLEECLRLLNDFKFTESGSLWRGVQPYDVSSVLTHLRLHDHTRRPNDDG
jgi:hypothetical protein